MAQISSINEVVNALRRRVVLIGTLVFLGALASFVFALNMVKIYEATAVVQIETPQITVNPGANGASQPRPASENLLALIEQKLMARGHLMEVIDKYELYAGSDMSLSLKVSTLRTSARIQALVDPANRWRTDVQPSGLIITVQMEDPVQAADIANEFLAQVLDEGRSRRSGRASSTLAFFEAEEARVNEEIAVLEHSIAEFKQSNAGSLPSGIKAQQDQLALLKEAQLSLEQKLIELETNSERLRADELGRQTELLNQQKLLLSERIAVINRYLDAAPEVERELGMLDRSLDQLQEEFKIITSRRADAAMTQAIESRDQFARFEVLESALIPEYPVSASRRKMAVAGTIASVLGALALALVLEWTSPILRTSAQVEKALGLRPVIAIPTLQNKRQRWEKILKWVLIAVVAFGGALIALGSGVARTVIALWRAWRGPQPE